MITLTPAQLHILCHALGRDDYGRLKGKTEYRNHYDAGDDAMLDVHALVLARLLEPYLCSGGWTMYRVTDEGRWQMLKQAPLAPAKTAAALRLRVERAIGLCEWILSCTGPDEATAQERALARSVLIALKVEP